MIIGLEAVSILFTWKGKGVEMQVLLKRGLIILGIMFGFFTTGAAAPDAILCHVHQEACKGLLSGRPVELEIFPKPVTAMTELTFRLTLPEDSLKENISPYIDLGMPGMQMGPNRVTLNAVSHRVYEGNGIIVKCPSGKRTWQATVTIPGHGVIAFVFDVRY